MTVLLTDYVRVLRRGWAVVLVAALVGLVGATAWVASEDDVYTSSTQLFVSATERSEAKDGRVESVEVAPERVRSYVAAAGGNAVESQVQERLGTDLDASVVVSLVPDTVIVQVTATGSDPDQVAAVAAAYAEVLPGTFQDLEGTGSSRVDVEATVVDRADTPTAPVPTSVLLRYVALLVLAVGAAFAILIFREVLRRERASAGAR